MKKGGTLIFIFYFLLGLKGKVCEMLPFTMVGSARTTVSHEVSEGAGVQKVATSQRSTENKGKIRLFFFHSYSSNKTLLIILN